MLLSCVFILILTCNELVAFSCGKGLRVNDHRGRKTCEPCPDDYYQDKENYSQRCQPCTRCLSEKWSQTEEKCKKETDTKCQCKQGFVPVKKDPSNCECDRGYELRGNGCVRCDDGYFSLGNKTPCKKWTECKDTGTKVSGTFTSDAICNEVSKSGPNSITTASSSNRSVPLTFSTTRRPHEGAPTQTRPSTTTKTSQANGNGGSQPPTYSDTGNHFGQYLLIFGIAGMVVLSVVTCKLTECPNFQKGPKSHTNDSLCVRPPVEESGDSSDSSLVKLNLEP